MVDDLKRVETISRPPDKVPKSIGRRRPRGASGADLRSGVQDQKSAMVVAKCNDNCNIYDNKEIVNPLGTKKKPQFSGDLET